MDRANGQERLEHPATEIDGLLYVARVRATGAAAPVSHAIFGRAFEPELTPLPPESVAPGLGEGTVRVRALDQLVLALAG